MYERECHQDMVDDAACITGSQTGILDFLNLFGCLQVYVECVVGVTTAFTPNLSGSLFSLSPIVFPLSLPSILQAFLL